MNTIEKDQIQELQKFKGEDPKSLDFNRKFKDYASLVKVDFSKFNWE